MSSTQSSEMLSVCIPSYTKPPGYGLAKFTKPVVDGATDVVIKVHAASINPIDVKRADGLMKMAVKDSFPYKIGYDCAGVITEVGAGVTKFKVGDNVYTRLPDIYRGAWSEYANCGEEFISLKPESMSFEEAAAVPLAAMTALQAFRQYKGDLSGKTVFVPAGLSGTGSYACQIAKKVFGAKVITTVSTSKVPMIKDLFGEGVIDEVIDYTKSDPKSVIQKGSVDFIFDTIGIAMDYLSLLRPKTGTVISIATTPSGDQFQSSSALRLPSKPIIPAYIRIPLNIIDWIRKWRASRWNATYAYLFIDPIGEDLDTLRGWIDEKGVKSIVGTTVDFKDIEGIRKACQVVFDAKGGVGKAVIKFSGN